MRTILLACLMVLGACASAPPTLEAAGVTLIPGAVTETRQPDGNSILLEGHHGLIVFDTGRHPDHTQKIIDAAKARGEPVVAIFNSHWHLDHIGGNILLRAAYPKAVVYSNAPALDDALKNFLARGAERNRKVIAEGKPGPELEDARLGVSSFEQGDRLRPDISIDHAKTLVIAGRRLDVHVAAGASKGDVWLYDPKSRTALIGDLLTVPAPFLDTACTSKWTEALNEVLATPFVQVIPGHGRVMARADIALYRDAFAALIACAKSAAAASVCADGWAAAAKPLLDDPAEPAPARAYAAYYVAEILRKPRPDGSAPDRPDCPL